MLIIHVLKRTQAQKYFYCALLYMVSYRYITKCVHIINELDDLGNSFDKSIKYTDEQKEFIKEQILDVAQ